MSTFYALDAPSMIGDLTTFWNSMAGFIPEDVTIQVENTGDIIDPISGDLTGTWSGDAQDPVTCTNSSVYAAPTGAVIRWETGDVLDGHRLRGHTYIVPCGSNLFAMDGTLATDVPSGMASVAGTFRAANATNFVIWHRPRAAASATAYHPAVTSRAGGYSVVTASSVPDRAVILRSRRD